MTTINSTCTALASSKSKSIFPQEALLHPQSPRTPLRADVHLLPLDPLVVPLPLATLSLQCLFGRRHNPIDRPRPSFNLTPSQPALPCRRSSSSTHAKTHHHSWLLRIITSRQTIYSTRFAACLLRSGSLLSVAVSPAPSTSTLTAPWPKNRLTTRSTRYSPCSTMSYVDPSYPIPLFTALIFIIAHGNWQGNSCRTQRRSWGQCAGP